MAPSREIEKLQRRWQENPLGLTFAPLAEAYRKEGLYADALELLEIGLSQHPNYVPAHIVRGRCYLDSQIDGAAQEAFRRVTELDPENVIALKGLADIAERAGRRDEAISRLERLLEFDRSNEEARAQLERLREIVPATEPAELVPLSVIDPAADVPPEAASLGEPAPSTEPEPEPAAASEAPMAEVVEPSRVEVEVETFQPVELVAAPATEYQVAADAESLRVDEPPTEVVPGIAPPLPVAEAPPPEPAPPEPAVPVEEPAPRPISAAAAEENVEPEPDLVVTETMAEVFLRQGHRELALAVYTQLASRDPDRPTIKAAIEQLRRELAPAAPPPTLPVYAAMLTGGRSIRAYFEQLLSATRPAPAGTGPAALSLGSVFGDEAPVAATPTAPSEPGPSFDEFYAEDAPTPELPPAPEPAATAEGDDLDGFTTWLKGLRR